jgi:hypothetical protein
MAKKSWKWIEAYEKARKKHDVKHSRLIADMTITRRKKKPKQKQSNTGIFGIRW